ncbi:hypothetical protein GJAV_G00270470 [Gymnothorax javanicus]|nr:hypothetical protein GJAV_G00270470 [Gymnothorax javanicus]
MEMTADPKVLPRIPLRLRGCSALLLGCMVLVSMTTASSPDADVDVLALNKREGAVEKALRTEGPSTLSNSGAPRPAGLPSHTDLPSPRSPQPKTVESNGTRTGSPTGTGQDLSLSWLAKVSRSRDSSVLVPGSLGSSDWTGVSDRVPARRTRDVTSSQSSPSPDPAWPPDLDPNQRSPALLVTLSSRSDSVATVERLPNASTTHLNTLSSRPVRSVDTTPELKVWESLFGTPDASYPPWVTGVQRGPPGSNIKVTSARPQSGEAAVGKVSSDYTSPGKVERSSSSLPLNPTGLSKSSDHLHASRDSALSDAAQGIHLLLNPPEMPEPSSRPFVRPPTTSRATPEPTMVPPAEFYPTHTMDEFWGSGDYVETMSFMGPDGEEFPMATSLPTDIYDQEDWSTEVYDTSFPSRVVPPLSSMHILISPTLTSAYGGGIRSTVPATPWPSRGGPSPAASPDDGSDLDWTEVYTIEPTEILLPDMNSLEYYTTLLAKENASAAQRNLTSSGHLAHAPLVTAHISPTSSLPTLVPTASANGSGVEESSGDDSGSGAPNFTTTDTGGVVRPHLENGSEPALDPSVVPQPSMTVSTSLWGVQVSTMPVPLPGATSSSTVDLPIASMGLDSQLTISTTSTEMVLRPTASATTQATPALTTSSISPTPTGSPATPTSVADQGTTTDAATTSTDRLQTTSKDEQPTTSSASTTQRVTTTGGPLTVTSKIPLNTSARQYLCNITKTETYLVRAAFPKGSTVGYAKSIVREILKSEFNRSVELQILKPPPDFVFRAVSGPVVYAPYAVINAIRQSARGSSIGLSAMPVGTLPDYKFQVHSVLQFVPSYVDVRTCSFSERVEKGLTMAYAEVRRRSNESTSFSVHILNITKNIPKAQRQQRAPVDITFAVRDAGGFLRGADVSSHLRLLNMVEFSYYLGFPVLQIAEPFHYPELNVTHLLRSSWVRTVLLGVLDQRVNERTFQAKMERRLAQLLGEVLVSGRRWKRATSVGNNSVQIVKTSRLEGTDHPLEVVYFLEGPSGERVPALTTSSMLNQLDVQRAAIVLGYRVQGVLAQPVEKLAAPPSETQSNNMWIIVGVVVPVLVVVLIIIILYWKMCRTDKLEFQPDAMATVQQRQKLQAPSVKGFDFAKLHLGQHSKDDIMVIQEPAPLPPPVKEVTPSENGDVPTPKSKTSSTKASRAARRRGRISPSDGDSVASDPSSGRESNEENLRAPVTPGEGKQSRKVPKNGPPPANGTDEQLSSASIFEHVDRMTRSSDGTRRVANKIQLIAMQPMPAPPQHSPAVTEKVSESAKINKEIQVALRHKSEIEHHRNKIRLRAKRRGHYDFPAMDDIMDTFGDLKDPDQIYQKAQMQIDKILDPEVHMPSIFMEPRKSARGKRSPKQRKKLPVNGMAVEDKDRLLPTDSDGTYRKYPGVNNVAYVSDPDQLPEIRSPSPSDDVFLAPGSPPPGPAPPPPPYVPPQPSIEEARQQMHSLLDDAFALVSPSSQGSTPGINLPVSSPRAPPTGQWGSTHPSAPALSPFSTRYAELGMSPPSVQSLLQRQGLGSGYAPVGESGRGEQIQPDALYSNRALYSEELPSSARPRPVGGTTGSQLHHLTQVGLSSRIGAYPGMGRSSSGPTGSSAWGAYRSDEEYSRSAPVRDTVVGSPDNSVPSSFQMPRSGLREPSAHLDSPGIGYPSAPLEENSPPSHSSASLIKAIREELMRLSQKQAAVPNYHG